MENILYYVTSRGANEQNLFDDERDYRTYLELLNKSKEENNFKLFAFTLLPNHLHLLIELKAGANISEIMQNLNTLYTKYYNSRYKKKGAVFHQRYKATYVEKGPNLLGLTRYIHLNAQKLNLVSEPKDYHYSSYPLYTEISADGKLRTLDLQDEIREVLGRLKGKAYQKFVAEVPSCEMKTLHKALHRGGFLGSEEFVERIKVEIHARSQEGRKEEQIKEEFKEEIKEEIKEEVKV
ncbi:transposase, partial [candidate division WOR-3 bacterium]|nr:transposase [candidate division WOR-3 bacterium]